MILRQDVSLSIGIVIVEQIAYDAGSLLIADGITLCAQHKGLTFKVGNSSHSRTLTQGLTRIFLQVIYKRRITLVSNHRQFVDVVNSIAQSFCIHAVSLLIHTDTQASPHLLTLGCSTIRMAEGTNLENVWIIPTLTQGRVREDESCRFIKAQQTFLVFQNQVVCRDIIRRVISSLHITIHSMTFLIYREVTIMYLLYRESLQILLIVIFKQRQVLIQIAIILILEHLPQVTLYYFPTLIISFVVGHFIDKEQREGLDTLLEQLSFFLKMALHCLTNLHLLDSLL